MAKFSGNANKYTESELKDRCIGRFVSNVDPSWRTKKDTYTNEGVWQSYTKLVDSFRVLLLDADGIWNKDRGGANAQIVMDTFLIRRSRGERVEIPQQVVPINVVSSDGVALLSRDDFDTEQVVSENEKLRWVFENMKLDSVDPKDAPSAGAYALLQEMQSSPELRKDFYKTLWPKLLTKEDSEKGSNLSDEGKPIIDLIERLQEAV